MSTETETISSLINHAHSLISQLTEARAQLAEANQRAERAENLLELSERSRKTNSGYVTRLESQLEEAREVCAEALKERDHSKRQFTIINDLNGKLLASSSGVLPEGAMVYVPDGLPRTVTAGDIVQLSEHCIRQVFHTDPVVWRGGVLQVVRPWHPPKAESREGDEYAQDPDAGTLASELCRIADSIGRNDCTRSWAEKFIYSIVDELPPAIASHVMRPPITDSAPKAPAASEEPANPKQAAAMSGGPFDAQDNARAADFLKRLRVDRGAIVSSADCSTMEIAFAQKERRWYVDEDGMGYVMRMKPWREECERLIEARANARDVSDSPSAPPAAEVGGEPSLDLKPETLKALCRSHIEIHEEAMDALTELTPDDWQLDDWRELSLIKRIGVVAEYIESLKASQPPVTAKGTQYAADITDEMRLLVENGKAIAGMQSEAERIAKGTGEQWAGYPKGSDDYNRENR